LDEVLEVGDRFTVLREGRTVFESDRGGVTARALAEAMIGGDRLPEDLAGDLEDRSPADGEVVARLVGVTANNPAGGQSLREADLAVHRGEILGIAGVEGNGQRELARVLAGLDSPESGEVRLPRRPGWIPQDRSREGLVSDLTLSENVALALHDSADFRGRWGRMDWPAVEAEARELVERFGVRTGPWGQRVGALSGGNSQKVVVGRELLRSADLLIAENPTRGLDLGAAAFVHGELLRLRSPAAGQPPGIVLISNDLDEVLTLSDRVLVLLRGRLTPVPDEERSRVVVGRMMLGMGTP
jgi:simple sugar transport system ATP-binding protein